ncbi:MAG: hypothetical protein ACE14M_15530 [Terriglobales bacterium]
MRKVALITLLALACLPLAAAETWNDVALIDTMCAAKFKNNADAHPRSCLMQCGKNGYGIITSDGTFLKFDSAGNEQAAAALQRSRQQDHIRVTVTGERQGGTIKVRSLKM